MSLGESVVKLLESGASFTYVIVPENRFNEGVPDPVFGNY
jgi:hypothetical protein